MEIRKYLEKERLLVDTFLDRYLPKASEEPKSIHKAMRYSVFTKGKRIRPILVIEAYRICRGTGMRIMPVACAIELIHTYSLIHDDLPAMDNDDYRRGKPALHKKFDEALAILAGDALLTLAFNLISRGKDASVRCRIIEDVSKAIGTYGMIGGQVMDIYGDKKNIKVLKKLCLNKTGALIAASLKSGALMAGARNQEIKALNLYGENLGMSFQIIDDILDKEGYFNFLGEAGSRRRAALAAKNSKNALLKIFGKKADTLRSITDLLLAREK